MAFTQNDSSSVLITGTTSGIGRGLMDFYVKKGIKVFAVNRRQDAALEALYPTVEFHKVDIQDAAAVKKLIADLVDRKKVPSIFVLNAGINKVDNDEFFSLDGFREVLNTNLFGALNFVAPLVALRHQLPETKIVAISSVTNYAANPYCLGYYISKKALTQSFKVFCEMYRKTNLKFKWVVLGPVLTPIVSSSDKFPKIMTQIKNWFSVSVDRTVKAIAKFAVSNRVSMIFPFRARILFRGIWLAQQLIPGFYRGRKRS